jgi:hypothetical protein
MKHLTLDDLVKLNEEENDFIINRMITYWKKGHKDIALDVIHHDYDKVRMNKQIVNFFKRYEETKDIF